MSRNQIKLNDNSSGEIILSGPRDPEELKPLCLDHGMFAGASDQKDITEWLGKAYGYNSQGYIMPCCWTVQEKGYEEEAFKPLMKEKLHISNANSIDDIIKSDEWKDFADLLVNKPDKAPSICWYFCGKKVQNYMADKPYMEGERVKQINKHK